MERATIVAKGPFIEPADLPSVPADAAAGAVTAAAAA